MHSNLVLWNNLNFYVILKWNANHAPPLPFPMLTTLACQWLCTAYTYYQSWESKCERVQVYLKGVLVHCGLKDSTLHISSFLVLTSCPVLPTGWVVIQNSVLWVKKANSLEIAVQWRWNGETQSLHATLVSLSEAVLILSVKTMTKYVHQQPFCPWIRWEMASVSSNTNWLY